MRDTSRAPTNAQTPPPTSPAAAAAAGGLRAQHDRHRTSGICGAAPTVRGADRGDQNGGYARGYHELFVLLSAWQIPLRPPHAGPPARIFMHRRSCRELTNLPPTVLSHPNRGTSRDSEASTMPSHRDEAHGTTALVGQSQRLFGV